MKYDEEPPLWVTALKLAIGAIVLIALVGLGLWYAAKGDGSRPVAKPDESWGIVADSPLRKKK
jgi:hypothetical protein